MESIGLGSWPIEDVGIMLGLDPDTHAGIFVGILRASVETTHTNRGSVPTAVFCPEKARG